MIVGLVLAISAAVLAAVLNPDHTGSACNGEGSWHFVNPQTGGNYATGTLDVFFIGCPDQLGVTPSKVNQNNVHFDVVTNGDCELEDAESTLPGKLNLSHLICTPEKPTPTPSPTPTVKPSPTPKPTPTVTPTPTPKPTPTSTPTPK